MSLLHRLVDKPVIAALRSMNELNCVMSSNVDHCFFMGGTITEISTAVERVKQVNKSAFIHIDLVRGLSKVDKEAVGFIAEYTGADGIVTPKAHLIQEAKQLGLYAVQHLFVIDSFAFQNGLKQAESVQPDAIEIMPGLVTKIIERFVDTFENIPVIASGLIETVQEVERCLQAGATAVTTSEQSLWGLTFDEMSNSQRE